MGKIIYRLAFLMVNKYYVVMRFKFQFFQLLRFLYTSWDTPEVFPLNFIHSLLIKKKTVRVSLTEQLSLECIKS